MWIGALIAIALVPYLPLVKRFFWSDDWYILLLSNVSSVGEFLRFFSFTHSDLVTPVYRPLPTEAFYFVMQNLFGLNPVPFHIVAFVVWVLGGYMLHLFLKELFGGKTPMVLIAMVFYLFSASHFTRLSYLSAFQEILLFTSGVASMLCMLRSKHVASFILLVVAFLSKETAVVIVPLMMLTQWYRSKWIPVFREYRRFVPFIMLLGAYMFLRFAVRGVGSVGEDYVWDFSLVRAVHTGFWYVLWSIGLPEFIIDYVGSGFRVVPKFWVDFSERGVVLLGLFWTLSISLMLSGALWLRKKGMHAENLKTVLFAGMWTGIALAPLLFLPTHKFVLGQSLALVGVAMLLAEVVSVAPQIFGRVILGIFIICNLYSISLYYSHHVSMQRSAISEKVYSYMVRNHANPPHGFYFENDKEVVDPNWGMSKQIDLAVRPYFYTVLYGDDAPEVIYEDYEVRNPEQLEGFVILNSSQFLQ